MNYLNCSILLDQFNGIKKIGRSDFAIVYSAIWKDGRLYYDKDAEKYVRSSSNHKVTLKYLHNSQNISNELLNEV